MNVTINEQQEQPICRTVNNDNVEIDLSNACGGHTVIHHCPPLFISVEGTRVHDGMNLPCQGRECRFPDSARFEILTDNLGCFSSGRYIFASLWIIAAALLVSLKF